LGETGRRAASWKEINVWYQQWSHHVRFLHPKINSVKCRQARYPRPNPLPDKPLQKSATFPKPISQPDKMPPKNEAKNG
jgi:hypothetical protein